MRGGCFLICCCVCNDLWLFCLYSPSPSDCLTGHKIKFEETRILSKTPHYFPRIHREAIEIFKHTNNFNKKEKSLKVNKTWLAALPNLKIQNSSSHLERENSDRPTTGHRPHNNESGSDHHARDITSAVYNDVNREHSVDSELQPRSQVLRRCRPQTQAKRQGEEVSLTNSMAYGTRRFNAAFTRALQ